jgi:hypothetical protein
VIISSAIRSTPASVRTDALLAVVLEELGPRRPRPASQDDVLRRREGHRAGDGDRPVGNAVTRLARGPDGAPVRLNDPIAVPGPLKR